MKVADAAWILWFGATVCVVWCGVVCGVVWCVVWYDVWCGVMWVVCGVVCGVVCDVVWCVVWCVMWCGVVWYRTLRPNVLATRSEHLRDGSAPKVMTSRRHAEIEGANRSGYFIRSQYFDTGQTRSIPEPLAPGSWQSWLVCCLVGCLTFQQHATASRERTCSDNCTSCHTEIGAADQAFYLTQSPYIDTGPTSSSVDPITPDAWQGGYEGTDF